MTSRTWRPRSGGLLLAGAVVLALGGLVLVVSLLLDDDPGLTPVAVGSVQLLVGTLLAVNARRQRVVADDEGLLVPGAVLLRRVSWQEVVDIAPFGLPVDAVQVRVALADRSQVFLPYLRHEDIPELRALWQAHRDHDR